jgi:hypothetical protein
MMKKMSLAVGTAALLALAALGAPAQAQPYDGPPLVRPHILPPPPPPPRHMVRPGYDHRYDRRNDQRRYDRHGPRRGMRDSDRDGVPDRYDRRPNNPYRS